MQLAQLVGGCWRACSVTWIGCLPRLRGARRVWSRWDQAPLGKSADAGMGAKRLGSPHNLSAQPALVLLGQGQMCSTW